MDGLPRGCQPTLYASVLTHAPRRPDAHMGWQDTAAPADTTYDATPNPPGQAGPVTSAIAQGHRRRDRAPASTLEVVRSERWLSS